MSKRKKHGNSLKNDNLHHLYEIRDKEDGDVFKYGISHDPIDKDGLSKRIRIQLDILNLAANWIRYFAQILIKNIPGRKKAKEIEREHIKNYREKYGRKPRGNRER
ncbi:MAG: hypothetical protein H6573_34980 [Lewinellaceae bacterium]|nr:hypothetical protein [Phaeodactylibacter sp.]MCB9352652.1 hypothetical protein [Lewinellaceae bacterium]